MEDHSYVPDTLDYGDVVPGNMAELVPCVKFLYQKLHAVIEQEGNDNQQEIFRIEVIPELRCSNNIVDLYKLICRTLNPGFLVTRQLRDQLAEALDSNNMNQRLKIRAAEIRAENGDPVLQNMSSYDAFEECFLDFSGLLGAILQKSILGVQLYINVFQWSSDITVLRTRVTEMLMNLGDRQAANELAVDILRRRRDSQTLYDSFLDKTYGDNPQDSCTAAKYPG